MIKPHLKERQLIIVQTSKASYNLGYIISENYILAA